MASYFDVSDMDCVTDLDLLLIGKTESGKSAVGNAVLNKEKFDASSSTTSATQVMKWAVGEYKRIKIKVVDGPGIGDTRLDTVERISQMHEWLNKAIMMNDRGYHAFLLVLRFGVRFTDEEKDSLDFLKQTFGLDFVKNRCVVVMTCGDVFQTESRRSKKTFEQWCGEQQGAFRDLIQECGGRILLFDSYAEGEDLDAQTDRLLAVVGKLGDKRYTNERFAQAAKLREKKLVEAKKPFLQGEVMEEISLITQALNQEIKFSQGGDLTHASRLGELSRRCEGLIYRVQLNDKNTGVLKELESRVMDVKQSVDHTQQVQQHVKQEKDKRKKEIEELQNKFTESRTALEAKLEEEARARSEAEERTVQEERERQQVEQDGLRNNVEKIKEALEAKMEQEAHEAQKLTEAYNELRDKTENLEKTTDEQEKTSTSWDKVVIVMHGAAGILGDVAPLGKAFGKLRGGQTEQEANEAQKLTEANIELKDKIQNLEKTKEEQERYLSSSPPSTCPAVFFQRMGCDNLSRTSASVSSTTPGDTTWRFNYQVADRAIDTSGEVHPAWSTPEQCSADAAKTISVQTNCSVAPPTSKTVFGTSWQFSGTFTCQGGDIQANGSDVVLTVPPGAVPKTTVMEIYGAIFIDSPDVLKKFRIPSDESLVTPIVEYIGLPISNFERSVDISLPHALPPDFDTESVKVYIFTVDDRGEVTLSCLPFRSKSNRNIVGEAFWEEDQARSKICISTSHFSGYFCTLCGVPSRLPSVFSMIFGSHVQSEHRERREIKLIVYLWDRRLNIKDYQTRFCREERELDRQFLKDMQVPLLNDVSSDSHLLMRMEFLDDEGDGQCWRHVSRAGGTRYLFKPLQARRLSEIMECCRRTEPIRVEWAVENKPGVEPGPVFQCCIDIMHAPESTREYEAALNEDLDDLRRSFYVRDLRVLCRHDTEREMSVPNLNATHESNFDPTQLKLNLSKSLTLLQAERLCLELGFAPRDIGNFHKKFSSESDVKTALVEACINRVGPDKLASKMPTLLEKLQLEPGLESAKKQTSPGRATVTRGAEPTARSIQVADDDGEDGYLSWTHQNHLLRNDKETPDCRKKLNVPHRCQYDTSETVPKPEQSLDENKDDTSSPTSPQHVTSVKKACVLELDSTSQRQHDVLSSSQTFDKIHRPNSSGYLTSKLLDGFSPFSTLSNGCDDKSSVNGNTIACDSTGEHIQMALRDTRDTSEHVQPSHDDVEETERKEMYALESTIVM